MSSIKKRDDVESPTSLSLEAYRCLCHLMEEIRLQSDHDDDLSRVWDDFVAEHVRFVFKTALKDTLSLDGVSNSYLRALWDQSYDRRVTSKILRNAHNNIVSF
jgi:hypothetical protein